ncbi:hypothetical protein AVEN_241104-1 [Araneus ventricosus]|uniref:Uncharacterized protein n=1 Tax=Araneus ventricosus TaxID=182803 RepID=A0A4Y2BLZ1_ARAVE|nr:hypothetical protein AVEN_241104-1 [Araneus ventricosus]
MSTFQAEWERCESESRFLVNVKPIGVRHPPTGTGCGSLERECLFSCRLHRLTTIQKYKVHPKLAFVYVPKPSSSWFGLCCCGQLPLLLSAFICLSVASFEVKDFLLR